jgi:hypothetical protein
MVQSTFFGEEHYEKPEIQFSGPDHRVGLGEVSVFCVADSCQQSAAKPL